MCIRDSHNPSLYGYALIQKPYLVPVGTVGTASVYMSCYTATNYGIYKLFFKYIAFCLVTIRVYIETMGKERQK